MKLTKRNKRILKKMGLKPTKKVYKNLSEKQIYKYNSYRQKEVGKKKYDYIEITEPGSFNRSIFKYKDLKEWDQRNFNFQEKWMLKDSKARVKRQKEKGEEVEEVYEKREYTHLYMSGDWFRMMLKPKYGKRELIYGMIESARSYIFLEVLDMLGDDIDNKYPSLLIDKSGKRDKKTGLTTVEFEKRAAGKEEELKAKEKQLRDMSNIIEQDVLQRLTPYEMYTFIKEDNDKINGMDLYIVGGIEAAQNITFKTFNEDFQRWQQPVGLLDKITQEVYKKYKDRLFV